MRNIVAELKQRGIDITSPALNEQEYIKHSNEFGVVQAKFLKEMENLVQIAKVYSLATQKEFFGIAKGMAVELLWTDYFKDDIVKEIDDNKDLDFDELKNSYSKSLENLSTENAAFLKLKDEIIALAKQGNIQALSLYLFCEKPILQDTDLIEAAKQIEKKKVKTPEEWEVVAALHSNDIVNVVVNKDLYSSETDSLEVKAVDLDEKVLQAKSTVYSYILNEILRPFSTKAIMDCNSYERAYKQSEYGKALANAQIGYYARYSASGWKTDGYSFLKMSARGRKILVDKETLKELSCHVFQSQRAIEKSILKSGKEIAGVLKQGNTQYLNTDLFAVADVAKSSRRKANRRLGDQVLDYIINVGSSTQAPSTDAHAGVATVGGNGGMSK